MSRRTSATGLFPAVAVFSIILRLFLLACEGTTNKNTSIRKIKDKSKIWQIHINMSALLSCELKNTRLLGAVGSSWEQLGAVGPERLGLITE